MFQKKVHYVSQLGSMDCGIACLTMILNYYGCKSDIVDIGAEIQIGRDGMTLAQMKELAEKYGFKFAAYQYNHEEKNLIEYLPAILCNDSHYVVVDKTKKKGKYILFDPANGKRVVDFLELKNGYKDILVSVIPSRNIKKIKKTKFKIEVKFSQFMIAIMLMLMCQLITLAVPMVVQKVIDSLSSAHITIHIWKITLLVLLIMCAHFVLSLLRQKILLNINMKLFKTMISNMIHKIFRLDVSFFEWHSAGDIGNRFNSINQLNDILTNGFINIIIQGITSLVCLAVMTSISPYLTAFVLVVSIIQIAIMILLNGKNLIKTKEYIYSQSTIQGELIDTLENIMEIKCMGMDNAVKSNLQNSYSKLIERFKGKTRISNLMNSFSSTLNLIFPLMIYVIGSYSVKQGGLTIGQLIAYATLVGYFTAPFTTVVLLLPSINSIKEVLLRYKELMIFRENYHTGVLVPGKFENLKISSVSYCYNSGQAYALNNVSLDLRRGERIAIVGLSGSGKSTLIKAILGAVDINQGCIEINNYDIKKDGVIDIWNALTSSEKKLVIRYPFDALKVNKAKEIATKQTERKFGKNGLGDRSDAFRHGIWNAEMTVLIGSEKAELFATAHEDKDTTGNESDGYTKDEHKKMDLHNNEIGRKLGADNLSAPEEKMAEIIYDEIMREDSLFVWLHE